MITRDIVIELLCTSAEVLDLACRIVDLRFGVFPLLDECVAVREEGAEITRRGVCSCPYSRIQWCSCRRLEGEMRVVCVLCVGIGALCMLDTRAIYLCYVRITLCDGLLDATQ